LVESHLGLAYLSYHAVNEEEDKNKETIKLFAEHMAPST